MSTRSPCSSRPLFVGASGESYREALIRGGQRYREAGAAVAVDEALRTRWPRFQDNLEHVVPGGFVQAVKDADTLFERDIGQWDWQFGEGEAQRVTQPALAVLGSESEALWARFGATHRWLLARLPDVEGYILPGATHFLQVENPREMAAALAAFFARHPIRALA